MSHIDQKDNVVIVSASAAGSKGAEHDGGRNAQARLRN